MTIQFIDGFDHYGPGTAGSGSSMLDGVYAQAAQIRIISASGPGGVGAVAANDDGTTQSTTLRKVLAGSRDLVGVGQRIYFPELPVQNKFAKILAFHTGLNSQMLAFYVQSTGAIGVYNAADTLIYQTDPVITANSWQFVEIRVGFEAAKYTLSIGINSITIYDNDNFAVHNGVLCEQIVLLASGRSFETPWRIRDLYIWDGEGTLNNTGMQGDRQVVTSFPTSDGPLQDWLPSTGSVGYAMIDEVPGSDVDFVSSNAEDEMANYGFTDIDTDITNISCVQVVGRMKKSDAGIGSFKFGMKSGSDLIEGVEKGLTTEWTYYWSVFETDPATDLKWTPLGVNDALVQLDRIS